MAKSKELTVEEKLRSLYRLQLIDSRIDTIRSVRGELPLEIEDLDEESNDYEIREFLTENYGFEVKKYQIEE